MCSFLLYFILSIQKLYLNMGCSNSSGTATSSAVAAKPSGSNVITTARFSVNADCETALNWILQPQNLQAIIPGAPQSTAGWEPKNRTASGYEFHLNGEVKLIIKDR